MTKYKIIATFTSTWEQELEVDIPEGATKMQIDDVVYASLDSALVDEYEASSNAEWKDWEWEYDTKPVPTIYNGHDVVWPPPEDTKIFVGNRWWVTNGAILLREDATPPSRIICDSLMITWKTTITPEQVERLLQVPTYGARYLEDRFFNASYEATLSCGDHVDVLYDGRANVFRNGEIIAVVMGLALGSEAGREVVKIHEGKTVKVQA